MPTSGYLERWYDAELALPEGATPATLTAGEVARIGRALSIVVVAGTIPRRLGGDADDDQLALDRKRARRTGHALRQALGGWVKRVPQLQLDDEIRRLGAQLDWESFGTSHRNEIKARLALCATFAIQANEKRWGKSAVVNLENELNWFTYALRD